MLPEDFNNIDDRDIIVDPSLGFIDEAAEITQESYEKIKAQVKDRGGYGNIR